MQRDGIPPFRRATAERHAPSLSTAGRRSQMGRSISVGVPSIDEDKEESQGSLARRNLPNHARSSVRSPTTQRSQQNEGAESPVASSEPRSERKSKKAIVPISMPAIRDTIERSFAELEDASEEMELKMASEKDCPSSPLSSPERRRKLKSGRNLTELMQLASAAEDQPSSPGSFRRRIPAAASCDEALWETSPPARSVTSSASSHDSSSRELQSSPLAASSFKSKPKYGRSVSKVLADAAAVAATVTPPSPTRRARPSPTASDSFGRAGSSLGRASFRAALQREESVSRRASRLVSDSSVGGWNRTVGRNGIFGSLGEEAKEEGFGRLASCPDGRSSTLPLSTWSELSTPFRE